jgi:hypothetical protein
MRISTLTTVGFLLVGLAACNNPKPAETAPPTAEAITAPEVVPPTNEVTTPPDATNTVTDPAAANAVDAPPVDAPRAGEDRRAPAVSGEAAPEAK